MRCGAYYRIGLSGTPLARSDKRSAYVTGGIGPVLMRLKPEVLQEEEVLARPQIRMVRLEQMVANSTWAGIRREAIVRSDERNEVLLSCIAAAAKPCWAFVKEIAHGARVTAETNRAGMSAEWVSGKDSTERRAALIEAQERGDFEVLVCSTVFQTGRDMPSLRSIVVGSGDKSVIATLQRIGRGMRVDKATGKTTFEVWDIWDEGHPLLDRHTDERRRSYEREGYKVEIITPSVVLELLRARKSA